MSQILIKGKKYELGEISFTRENVKLMESLLKLADQSETESTGLISELIDSGLISGFQRLLQEALEDGNKPDVAARAVKDLKFNLKQGSDLMNAFSCLGNFLGG